MSFATHRTCPPPCPVPMALLGAPAPSILSRAGDSWCHHCHGPLSAPRPRSCHGGPGSCLQPLSPVQPWLCPHTPPLQTEGRSQGPCHRRVLRPLRGVGWVPPPGNGLQLGQGGAEDHPVTPAGTGSVLFPPGCPSVSQLFCLPLGPAACLLLAAGPGCPGQGHRGQTSGASPRGCSTPAGGVGGGRPTGPQGLPGTPRGGGMGTVGRERTSSRGRAAGGCWRERLMDGSPRLLAQQRGGCDGAGGAEAGGKRWLHRPKGAASPGAAPRWGTFVVLPEGLGGTRGWGAQGAVVGGLPCDRCRASLGFFREWPCTISFSPTYGGTGTAACRGTWWGAGARGAEGVVPAPQPPQPTSL